MSEKSQGGESVRPRLGWGGGRGVIWVEGAHCGIAACDGLELAAQCIGLQGGGSVIFVLVRESKNCTKLYSFPKHKANSYKYM